MSLINNDKWKYSYITGSKQCLLCEETTSNCCGAPFLDHAYPDNDICSDCRKRSDSYECENCKGEYEVDLTFDEFEELLVDMIEDKADRLSDERRGH